VDRDGGLMVMKAACRWIMTVVTSMGRTSDLLGGSRWWANGDEGCMPVDHDGGDSDG
jgi:hypothetical protein